MSVETILLLPYMSVRAFSLFEDSTEDPLAYSADDGGKIEDVEPHTKNQFLNHVGNLSKIGSRNLDNGNGSCFHKDSFIVLSGFYTIGWSDGDVIDCIDIYKQPAFDHPLLKNHIIQMSPSSYPKAASPETENSRDVKVASFQLWNNFEKCPNGTIPILRTQRNGGKISPNAYPFTVNDNSDNYGDQTAEYAGAITKNFAFYGASSESYIWNPQVQVSTEYSGAGTWLLSNRGAVVNGIAAGWIVNPVLYGDTKTRIFISWIIVDSKTPGCYDLSCPGFVQTSSDIPLGTVLTPVSEYDGNQYAINYSIHKDNNTGNWWFTLLTALKNEIHVGYWPASIFTSLSVANRVLWGGQVSNLKTGGEHTSTQMGSGHFPKEGDKKAAYFGSVRVLFSDGTYGTPLVDPFRDHAACYDSDMVGSYHPDSFYFGGPGRNPTCI
ncbi:uncharacterized protein LOC18434300 [Amborella trichopoda]|nr:uncharacterized protein LOC18434300 [Amborella trichopoda]|eukprot:XP_020523024.1 uncharacterized protein LOC18434300 [Amborella trichopoda]